MFHATVTKVLRLLLLVLTVSFLFSACKSGDPGPKGDTGATGPAGPAGATGATGNANVIQISFGAKTIPSGTNGSLTLPLTGVDRSLFEKSAIMTYVQYGGLGSSPLWYQIPGYVGGFTGVTLNVRFYQTSTTVPINLQIFGDNYNLPFSLNFDAIRVLIIPATTQTNGGRKAAVDYSNYEAVKAYYNLPD